MTAPDYDRKQFLGGSDAAAILGVSEWTTPLAIYLRKIGEPLPKELLPDEDRERRLRRGRLMEPVVLAMLEAELPIKIVRRSTPANPNRYYDHEHGFMAAEIDFEWEVTREIIDHFSEEGYVIEERLLGSIQNGEIKTAHPFVAAKKFGEEGTEEIPIDYAAQAMHGLMVAQRDLTMFPVLVGSDNLIIYWVKRDNETIASMRAQAFSFWTNHVLKRVPPAPVNLPDVYHLFRRDAETRIEASPEIAALVQDLVRATGSLPTLLGEIDDLKFKIGSFMLGAEQMKTPTKTGQHALSASGQDILTVTLQEQSRLDQKLLKERHPVIAAACMKAISFFTFRPKRAKKE